MRAARISYLNREQVWLGGSVVADFIIAVGMVYLVRILCWQIQSVPSLKRHAQLNSVKRKTWSKTTDRRITQLIRTTVETGVLSATAASLDLGLYLAFSRNNLHVTMYVSFRFSSSEDHIVADLASHASGAVLSKLYSNALMASLNSRAGIYQRSQPSVSREDERYSTPGHFERDQFTTIGVAMTVDGSASVRGVTAQDTKSVRCTD
jgi:hypothetical protein